MNVRGSRQGLEEEGGRQRTSVSRKSRHSGKHGHGAGPGNPWLPGQLAENSEEAKPSSLGLQYHNRGLGTIDLKKRNP